MSSSYRKHPASWKEFVPVMHIFSVVASRHSRKNLCASVFARATLSRTHVQSALTREVRVRLRFATASRKRARHRIRRNDLRTRRPKLVSCFKGSSSTLRHSSRIPAAHSRSPSRTADNTSSSYARTHINGSSVSRTSARNTRLESDSFFIATNTRAFQKVARSRYFGEFFAPRITLSYAASAASNSLSRRCTCPHSKSARARKRVSTVIRTVARNSRNASSESPPARCNSPARNKACADSDFDAGK